MSTPSNPNWPTGYVPSAAEWSVEWSGKVDYPAPVAQGGTGSTDAATANANLAQRALIASTPYTAARLTAYGVRTSTGAITINLPALANVTAGDWMTFVDVDQDAGANNITFAAASGDAILFAGASASSFSVGVDGATVSIVANAGEWSAVAGGDTSGLSAKANAAALGVSPTANDMGSFTGSTIPDSVSAKAGMQALETAVEAVQASSGVSFTQAGTGAVARTLQARERDTIHAADFGVVGDNATDNLTALTNAIAQANAIGGADILLPAGRILHSGTIDVKYPRVRLVGSGWTTFHDAGSDPTHTVFVPTFAGTAMKIRTPYASGAAKNTGAGAVGISFDGNNLATMALEVDSVSGCDIDVFATGFVGTTVYNVKAGVSGTDLGEACDVQFCKMFFRARQIDTTAQRASHILTLAGSSNANVSLNRGPSCGISVYAQHWDGHLLYGQSADNNDIVAIGVRSGGSGNTVYGIGPTVAQPQGFSSNRITYAAGAGPIYMQGTSDSGVTQGVWNEVVYDDGNGTPAPTAGTGSIWLAQQTSNGHFNSIYSNGAVYGYFVTSITNGNRMFDGGANKLSFALATANVDAAYLAMLMASSIPSLDGPGGSVGLSTAGNLVLEASSANTGVHGLGISSPYAAASSSYANDAAAASGGVPVGGIYRNGSVLQVRVS